MNPKEYIKKFVFSGENPKEDDIVIGENDLIRLMEEYSETKMNSGWVFTKDKPLVKFDKDFEKNGKWESTENGQDDFIAAVPYTNINNPNTTYWWIHHCVLEDEMGLCVIGDDGDTHPASWGIEDVELWKPVGVPYKKI